MPNKPAAVRRERRANQEQDRNAVKIHFKEPELAAMEERARNWSRMDWADKVRLINQSRRALALEAAFEAIKCEHAFPEEGCDSCTVRFVLGEF